ncbi:MAG: nucleotidyltransferase domain-containing protein [Myxococcales bacterium]|nr:nucleotidyltransferase domain-containing protein [Myxococcales bacterium]
MAGLPGMIEKPLAEFAAYVRRRFGERLEQLVLFGSWARGDADPLESDIDVLVVVRGLTVDELMELVGESARISVQYNLQINPLGMTADYYEELRQDDRLLYREVAREGVPL